MQDFLGTGVALITPFKEDRSIDFEALERLVEFQIDNGVDYLVVMGTTAEAVTLTESEKKLVEEKIIAVNNKRLPLVLGLGGNNTAAIVESLHERDLSAYKAILSVSPYYNKPTQEGLYQHFKAIAEATTIPIILYNVPSRTSKNMDPNTVIRLANDFDNIIGIKEAAGEMDQALELINNSPKDFMVISGDDMIALPMTLAGGAGVISVIGQAIPKDFSDMIRLGLERKEDEAYAIHNKVKACIDYIFEEGNPVGIKSMLHSLGFGSNEVRLPLVKSTNQLKQKIDSFVKAY